MPWVLLACVITVGLAGLAPLATLASDGRIAVMDLMSDPAEVTGIPWYIGAVTDLNLFVWAAGAAIFLLGAVGLRRIDAHLAMALAWLGAFTALMTMGDRFLFHEIIVPWLFGLPQLATFALYALILALILARYWRVLLRQPEVSILLLAFFGLGASLALDTIGWDATWRRVAEETAKMLGAAALALFPAAVIVRHLSRVPADRDETARPTTSSRS